MASDGPIAALDLRRGVTDPEALAQVTTEVVQKRIVAWRFFHNEMDRERDLRCAHRPNVKIVDLANVRKIR